MEMKYRHEYKYVCNAKQNAKNNQINNIHFVCNKAEEQIV